MTGLNLIAPEIFLSVAALLALPAELLLPKERRGWVYHWGWISALLACTWIAWPALGGGGLLHGTGSFWTVDPMSQFFKVLVLAAAILCLFFGLEYAELPASYAGSFTCLLLFACVGMMLLVSSTDLLMSFVALELISLPGFVLAGFERGNPKSNEGAVKYFIFGAFSSAVFAYGISLYYGAAGSTSLLGLKAHLTPLLAAGLLFSFLGFAFKASLAPMHFWAPDAYEGAPLPVAAFLSIAPKIAALGAIARIFDVLLPSLIPGADRILEAVAILTMTGGNLLALFQTDVKRLLAYSSIAQAGYLMIAVVCGGAWGLEGLLAYSFVYVLMNAGAFAVAQAVGEGAGRGPESYALSSFDGLSRRSLPLALAMAFFLVSLAGIPPLAGFMGKLYIFASAVSAGRYPLAAIGLLNSVLSAFYYADVIRRMFLSPAPEQAPRAPRPGLFLSSGIAIAIAGVLVLGAFPQGLFSGVQASAATLP